jgi:hypothetical protein
MAKEIFRFKTSWTRPDGIKGSVIFDTYEWPSGEEFDSGFVNYLKWKGCTDIKTEKLFRVA